MNYSLNSNTDKFTPFDLDFQLKFVLMLVVTYKEKKLQRLIYGKGKITHLWKSFILQGQLKYLFLELLIYIIPRSQPLWSLTEILKWLLNSDTAKEHVICSENYKIHTHKHNMGEEGGPSLHNLLFTLLYFYYYITLIQL